MPNSPLIAVLVNEPVTRERLLDQLRSAGYYVQSYLSSAPAAMISAARPDLIILDLHLAETATSWSLLGTLREHGLTSSTPIIALMSTRPDRESDQLQLSLWGVQVVFGSDGVTTAVQKTLVSTRHVQQI